MDTSTPNLSGEFVALADLHAVLGANRSTIRRRLRRLGIVAYTDPLDERSRLVRREDVERLLRPRPASRATSKVG